MSKAKRKSLFERPHMEDNLVDAILDEIEFANGIEAALQGTGAVDKWLMSGVKELMRAHQSRLAHIGRLAERQADELKAMRSQMPKPAPRLVA